MRTDLCLCLGFAAAMLRAGDAAPNQSKPEQEKPDLEWVAAAQRRVYESLTPHDERGFARLDAGTVAAWLARSREEPQTLERYRMAARVRPSAECRTVVLQPLGEFTAGQKKMLEVLREYAEVFFQLPARVAEPVELAAENVELQRQVPLGHRHGAYERQYDADKILDHVLAKRLPKDAVLYLGVSWADLWSGKEDCIFGLGSLDRRVGVCSLCRYFPEFWGRPRAPGDEQQALRRACRLLGHEAGHSLGLDHCLFYRCAMNPAATVEESDAMPVELCPLCHRKLFWNIQFDPLRRFGALQKFWEKQGFESEARWFSERAKNWAQAAPAKDE